ncbi:MAG TPA: O-antigen ligase family protein, partial [Verrucomicrobiae bacterium]
FGGFRSVVIICCLTFAVQFCLEGVYRTRLFPILLLVGLASALVIVPYTDKLPRSVQRTFSFLPIQVDPAAKADAQASLEWRLEMWRVLWPEVHKYLFKGKGYGINPIDLYLAEESTRRGLAKNYEQAIIVGDYHNGPLSVLIPFGIWGMIAFLWFLIASFLALRRNYLYGEPALKRMNTFILGYFVVRMLMFFVFFGGITLELYYLAGLVGLSVSLNGGVRHKSDLSDAVASTRPALA